MRFVDASGDEVWKVPKGYVPMLLVGDGEDDGEQGQRVLVHVKMLREPCIAALLEMAAEQFGHGQRGVLRIPCDAVLLEHMMSNGLGV
ncbi:hypothetical protein BAE44_0024466 [Dichanthelium oligosanthes]|uniref:Auxin-responsive protein SAUR71 n=1 Tax=Dichanthelium oligosanthes TaxID=888268 RepID=A0A1E5UNX8_9POAL|nr:hypothetical protein BAE44_0024466 [Dichanthelium oligosanthes]